MSCGAAHFVFFLFQQAVDLLKQSSLVRHIIMSHTSHIIKVLHAVLSLRTLWDKTVLSQITEKPWDLLALMITFQSFHVLRNISLFLNNSLSTITIYQKCSLVDGICFKLPKLLNKYFLIESSNKIVEIRVFQ